MSYHVRSGSIFGIEGIPVHVEVDLLRKLPSITIVGLPDSAVRESADRVRSALQQSGFEFPRKRIVINLAPADIKKNGASFDLPIAIAILAACGHIPQENIEASLFIGELSLSGALRPVRGVLSLAMMAQKNGLSTIFVPRENAYEASLVPNISVIPVSNLCEAVEKCMQKIHTSLSFPEPPPPPALLDMKDVKGQYRAKRALEIAATGGHNLLMIGAPGCGKSMLSLRMPSILPEPSVQEVLEIIQVYSAAGLNDSITFKKNRPFRAPHHSIRCSGMIGNANLQPGELSLAHHGVLFLDELPEFRRDVLEALRSPLENRYVHLVRAYGRVKLPANISLIAAANPCPCGYYGHPHISCRCSFHQRQRYMRKLSGPFFDRIDMHLWIEPVPPYVLMQEAHGESSAAIRSRVHKAREIQKQRYEEHGFFCNAQLSGKNIDRYTPKSKKAQHILEKACTQQHLSARSWTKIIKIARSIADLEKEERIEEHHMLEAINYRFTAGGVV